MRVSDYVLSRLAAKGIDKAFVVSGAANATLVDAFNNVEGIDYVALLHEQAAGFAAEGYAKTSGKIGVAIATSGPGGMNLITPMGNCFYDSVPALFLTGQINSGFLRPDPAVRQVGFQETDIVAMATPVTKYAAMVKNAEDIRYELEKALYLCEQGRPGPVLLDLPMDVQKKDIDPQTLRGFDSAEDESAFSTEGIEAQIREYLSDLSRAKRPVILVGGGVRIAKAVDEVLELGRILKVPTFPTWNALDTVTSDYEYYGGRVGTYGGPGRNFGLQNADLFLGIGTRVPGRITGGNLPTFLRNAKKYVVDVDKALLNPQWQEVPMDVNVYSDAKFFIECLATLAKETALPDFSEWMKQVAAWRDTYDPVRPEYLEQEEKVNPYAFIKVLSDLMKKEDVYVVDCGGNVVVSNQAFKTKQGQRYFSNNGNSPMGFSFSGAIGAWFAPHRGRVVCVIGDGGFNMNIQELQTLKEYGVGVKTFIMNNHSYGIIKAYQDTNLGGRYSASEPGSGYHAPDFVKISEAYGIRSETITANSELQSKIEAVLGSTGPVVCDVDCGDWYEYLPRIFGFNTPIEDMYPYLPREEFRKNMIIDPVSGWETPAMPNKVEGKRVDSME